MVSLADVVHVRAGRLDHAGGLVPEHHRDGTRADAVHDREVGVADPRGSDADEDLPGAGALEVQLLQLQGPAGRIGTR